MKINIYYMIIFIVIMIPLTAYVDTIRTGTYPFQQYLAICMWEAGILLVGIILGNKFVSFEKSKNYALDEVSEHE